MKNTAGISIVISFVVCLLIGCSPKGSKETANRSRLMNAEWKFIRDSIPGAENPAYDDSEWMQIDLPHDYSIMDLPGTESANQIGPFSKKSPGNGNSTGHVLGGTGWYRKSFVLDKEDAGKNAILKFDGVYLETQVWVNGKKATTHINGYTPFWIDITPLLNEPGKSNHLAIRVDNHGRNSRWYSGSGIYRNVHLVLVPPVHVPEWGVFITTPAISDNSATVDLEVTTRNTLKTGAEAKYTISISDKDGNVVGTLTENINIPAASDKIIKKQLAVQHPKLWSLDTPDLYKAEVRIETEGHDPDVYHQSFGIRTISFSADKGFELNGAPILLKGGCLHHDNGFLGAAAIERAEIRKVELMKANGYNAIRCSHNPPSEVFLKACDELGMLVINEFTDMWETYKNPRDYAVYFKEWWKKDLTDMLLRDRNHPSIIMWSIGNEIPKENVEEAVRIGTQLAKHVKALDPTRAVTEAVTSIFTPGGWENSGDIFGILDVSGYNYKPDRYAVDHEKFPDRIMYGSESFPLDAFEYWSAVEKYPYVIGDFVWTSMDYIGEVAIANTTIVPAKDKVIFKLPDYSIPASVKIFDMMQGQPSAWPNYVAWCGDFDITGDKKPQMLYRDILWDNSLVEVNVHEPMEPGMAENVSGWGWPREWPVWNWDGHEGQPIQVRVFTKAPHVKLQLNGKTIGEKQLSSEDEFIAVFEIPYQPGTLTAIALRDGKEIARKELKSAGKAIGIRLTSDRKSIKANRNDLAFIKIEVVDREGLTVPTDSLELKISVSGSGELVGSGSANPADMHSVNNEFVKTFKGKAQAIIRPYGNCDSIRLSVSADGLSPGELLLKCE